MVVWDHWAGAWVWGQAFGAVLHVLTSLHSGLWLHNRWSHASTESLRQRHRWSEPPLAGLPPPGHHGRSLVSSPASPGGRAQRYWLASH